MEKECIHSFDFILPRQDEKDILCKICGIALEELKKDLDKT